MFVSVSNRLTVYSVLLASSNAVLWVFLLYGIMKSSKSISRDKSSFRLSIFDNSWLVVGGFPQTW